MGNQIDYANKETVRDLDTIYITGGGYIDYPFKGISRDSAMGWEEAVWGGDLTRSQDFVLTNIDDVNFGLVARCEISYKYMNIQDYKALMQISKQRTCRVTFYNREKAEWEVAREMSFTGNELGKLYAFGTDYLGVTDISIKLVATNRDKEDLISSICRVTYNPNGGSGNIESQTATWSDGFKLSDGNNFTPPSGFIWDEKNFKNQELLLYPISQSIWSDNENTYCNQYNGSYKLDKNKSSWIPISWNINIFDAYEVWTDGTNTYYSPHSYKHLPQWELDKKTNNWIEKSWNENIAGQYIWRDGTNTYYSNGSKQLELDVDNGIWVEKQWIDNDGLINNLVGFNVWKTKDAIYCIYQYNGNQSIKINTATSTIEKKTWNMPISPAGLWSDGNTLYWSTNESNFMLSNDIWVEVDLGKTIDYMQIWSDGDKTYYLSPDSKENYQFVDGQYASLTYWFTKDEQGKEKLKYRPAQNITIFNNLDLFAHWE